MKSFGLGLLSGVVLGAIVGYVKNPQTGNTIKHDFKQQIDETIIDSNNIKKATNKFNENKDYLVNDGAKLVEDTLDSISDRIDGFKQQIAPNLRAVEEKLAEMDIEIKIPAGADFEDEDLDDDDLDDDDLDDDDLDDDDLGDDE